MVFLCLKLAKIGVPVLSTRMKIFLNDVPVKVVPAEGHTREGFDSFLTGLDEMISVNLIGDVLIFQATTIQVFQIIRMMEVKKLKKLKSITVAVDDVESVKQFIKDQFKIVKAAGGLVVRKDRYLMIYRNNLWDLPKGKLKKTEKTKKAAVREVEEECGIRVKAEGKICATWHSYVHKGKRILKKSTWYEMSCLDDSNLQPQEDEGITEVRWMTEKEVLKALKKSYASISGVFECYAQFQSL